MLQYIIQQIKYDYRLVSLDGTIGYFTTNISLVLHRWYRRFYSHLVTHNFQFNLAEFIRDNPINSNDI